ncbi:unnamed protein product [Notodromas monacha]|uniref:Cell cycle control protein n=1 Tax=Notodromas monacha TaxID=399045 RepID=A0A7R9BEU8_9CRUS|nr:unnamed protein product [Notodromas monacha]CAG0914011.1 unnamed protein product [Notodromas monacha]
MSTNSDDKVKPVNLHKPSGTAIEQQRLPAWQPILTAGTVLPMFFVVGIAFIPIGVGMLHISSNVKEKVVDYTDCGFPGNTCADQLKRYPGTSCTCTINFKMDKDWTEGRSVYVYYKLTNYYQNHRRYVKSRDDVQLLGSVRKEPSENCGQFSYNGKLPIVPCGAIANSLFNDTYSLSYTPLNFGARTEVKIRRDGIAWDSDIRMKFANPQNYDPAYPEAAFRGTAKPFNWPQEIWRLTSASRTNDALRYEPLMVWMRTSAFPDFRKNYGIIDNTQTYFKNGLPAGNYELQIKYSYPVKSFNGTKSFVLATTSLFGGKNPFLGFAYISVGGLFLVTGIVLVFIHLKFGKSVREMVDVDESTAY